MFPWLNLLKQQQFGVGVFYVTDQFSHPYNNEVFIRFIYKEPCIPFIHFQTDIYSIFSHGVFSSVSQNKNKYFPPQNSILSMFFLQCDLTFKHHLDEYFALKGYITICFPTWIVFWSLNYATSRFCRRIYHESLSCYGKLECITLLFRPLQCSMNYQSTVVTKWRKSTVSGFPKDRGRLSKTRCRNAYTDISFPLYPPFHHHPLRPV